MGRSRYHKCATLSDEHRWGNFATVRCNYCRAKRHYLPADLITLFGDMEIDRVERRMRCEACGKREYIHVHFWKPIAEDEPIRVVRRLVRVDVVRVPIWRDEKVD